MKTYVSRILIFLLTCSLLTGCGQERPSPVTTAAPTETVSQTTSVHTVEELLAALTSGADITLEPGTYDLSAAADYGKPTQDADYRWDEHSGALVISGLDGLTIHGLDAVITHSSPKAELLILENCTHVTLEGLTFRREGAQQAFSSLSLQTCQDVTLRDLTLEDGAVQLVELLDSRQVSLLGCDLSGSAATALDVSGSQAVTMELCRVHDLQPSDPQSALPSDEQGLVSIGSCQEGFSEDVTIQNCRFENNSTGMLLLVDSCKKVWFEDNLVSGSTARSGAFCFWNSAPHILNNQFEDNVPWSWYTPYSEYGVDEVGADLTPDKLPPALPLPEPGPQEDIPVYTAEEFLDAIGPDTRIFLNCELLDLSTAPGYGQDAGEYYFWENTPDGPQLVIHNVDNLTITAGGRNQNTISAQPRYANVLSFRFCTNLTLSRFTAGHTEEPGFCMGGVLDFRECRRMKVEDCGLFGCGILGISTKGGDQLTVTGCDIYECSFGGISLVNTAGVVIENTSFRDLGGPEIEARNCPDALRDGMPIPGV